MSKNKPRTYDKEFKLNAINLYLTNGRPYDQISDELGIPVSTLVTWACAHVALGPVFAILRQHTSSP